MMDDIDMSSLIQDVVGDLQCSADESTEILQRTGRGYLTRLRIVNRSASIIQGLYLMKSARDEKSNRKTAFKTIHKVSAAYRCRIALKARRDRIDAMQQMLMGGADLSDSMFNIEDDEESCNPAQEDSFERAPDSVDIKEENEQEKENPTKAIHTINHDSEDKQVKEKPAKTIHIVNHDREDEQAVLTKSMNDDDDDDDDDEDNNKQEQAPHANDTNDKREESTKINRSEDQSEHDEYEQNVITDRIEEERFNESPFDIRLVPQRAISKDSTSSNGWQPSHNTIASDDFLYLGEVNRIITPPIGFYFINNREILLKHTSPTNISLSLSIGGDDTLKDVEVRKDESGVHLLFVAVPVVGFHVLTVTASALDCNGEEVVLHTQVPVETYCGKQNDLPTEAWKMVTKLKSYHETGEIQGYSATSLLASLRASPYHKLVLEFAAANRSYDWLSRLLKKSTLISLPSSVKLPTMPKELLLASNNKATSSIVKRASVLSPAYPIRVLSKYSNSDYLPPKYLSEHALSLIERGLLPPERRVPTATQFVNRKDRCSNIPPWVPAGRNKPSKLQKLLANSAPKGVAVETIRKRVLPPLVNYNYPVG